MPHPRPPHLSHETTRHGRRVWYVRVGPSRIRLRADYGTPEFWAQYHAAIAGELVPANETSAPNGSPAWLIDLYREVDAGRSFALAPGRQRENIFKHIIRSGGMKPYRAITQAVVIAGRDRRTATPSAARNYLDALRGLFKWAKSTKYIKT